MKDPTDEEKYLSRIIYQIQRSLETAANQTQQLQEILENIENVEQGQIKYGVQQIQGFYDQIGENVEQVKEEHIGEKNDGE